MAMNVPVWFRVVAVLALLWNLFGLLMFWQNLVMTPEQIAALPDAKRQITLARPGWTFIPFGISTVAGVIGSAGLLLRKRWAAPLLLLSLLGVVVLFAAMYAVTPVWALTGARGAVFPIVLALIAAFLWVYARKAAVRGWLR